MRTKTSSKKSLTDQASELVEQMTPHVEAARERIVNDYLPAAQSVLADARETAKEVAQDARAVAQDAAAQAEKSTRKSRKKAARAARSRASKMATAAAAAAPITAPLATRAADKLEPKPKRRKRYVLLAGLVGLGAFLFKKMRTQTPAPTSYAPPRPAPRPTPVPDATMSTPPVPPSPPEMSFEPASDAATTDAGGASPDELLADASEEPHMVTTPDQPVEVEDVSSKPNPK